jgi:CrcB protein
VSRSAHLRPGLIALVGIGGAVGTAARYGLTQALPQSGGWPTATFTANLLGALLLGALLEALVRRGPEAPRAQRLRLGLGTGLLGGFTTFSSLAIEIERLIADGRGLLGLTYGLLSVVLGVGCCLAGVIAAARHHHWRSHRLPADPDAAGPGQGMGG